MSVKLVPSMPPYMVKFCNIGGDVSVFQVLHQNYVKIKERHLQVLQSIEIAKYGLILQLLKEVHLYRN